MKQRENLLYKLFEIRFAFMAKFSKLIRSRHKNDAHYNIISISVIVTGT